MTTRLPQTQRGYEEPMAVQVSVFLANRVGQLRELLELLAQNDISVLGLSIVDSTDWAVIRFVFGQPDKAREILRTNGLAFTQSEVLLAELAGETAMSELCGHLVRAEINIHFAYPLTVRSHDHPVMVLHVDNSMTARRLLVSHGFRLLGDEDLAEPA